jgi:hypothetical protein
VIKLLLAIFLSAGISVMAYSQKAKSSTLQKAIFVNSEIQLKEALSFARPGDSIILKDGTYTGEFIIPSSASGTAKRPIVLTGTKNAVLDGGDHSTGYVLHLQANYWKIKGITVTNGLKGIVTDGASHNLIDNIFITKIGEEGIHFRKFSSHNTLQHSEITHVGLKTPGYGEAVYIGSAHSNWAKYSNGEPDKCDSNKVINNKIGPYVAAECIDVKEGTTGGIISGNTFESQGITGANSADSWIDVKGNHYLIENNTGYNTPPSVLKDGYQVNCAYAGWGSYNEFKNNISHVNASGHGFNVRLKSSKGEAVGNKVYTNNIVKDAASGVANIALTD